MTEAIFGLIGVAVGAMITWFQAAWSDRRERQRHGRYLAIRVVCVLDKYIEDCAAVVSDDGRRDGQRDEEGVLTPQVEEPSPPAFPEDLDWRSIEHEVMYRLLSLPSEAEAAKRMIGRAAEHAFPPDFEEAFEERQYQYARLGLAAFKLTKEMRKKFGIPPKELGDWDPIEHLTNGKKRVEDERSKRHLRLAADASSLV